MNNSRSQKRNLERLHKKQLKKARGMLNRIAIAKKNGNQEELDRVKKDYKAWKEKFNKNNPLNK